MNKAFEVGKICCICGERFYGHGNDPHPIKEEGECCFECNCFKVIPARLKRAQEYWKENKA